VLSLPSRLLRLRPDRLLRRATSSRHRICRHAIAQSRVRWLSQRH
jgi:hypothetical protein